MNDLKIKLEKDFSRNLWCLLGLPFDAINMSITIEEVLGFVDKKQPCFLSTPNLNFLCAAQVDFDFKQSVINSELSIADGFPIILIAKLLNIPLPERVTGSDLMARLYAMKTDKPLKIFFFGGAEGVGEIACEKINQTQSGLDAVGCYVAGFGTAEEMSSDEIIHKINQDEYDFLVVALGAKKGQAWIEKNRHKIHAPVISHLGAVINFFAGSVIRAPKFFQNLGLEWLWRIYQEPQLWKRYFSDSITFLKLFLTKVMPYWWWIKSHRSLLQNNLDCRVINASESDNEMELVLFNSATVNTINPLRKSFIEAILKQKNIVLNLTDVSVVDGAFIALVLLLYKHLQISECSLKLINANVEVKKVFNWNQSEFLLAN